MSITINYYIKLAIDIPLKNRIEIIGINYRNLLHGKNFILLLKYMDVRSE